MAYLGGFGREELKGEGWFALCPRLGELL